MISDTYTDALLRDVSSRLFRKLVKGTCGKHVRAGKSKRNVGLRS